VVSEYRLRRRVQFYETDAAGIVHFSWFFRYMEEAEHALWREAGLSIAPVVADVGWPRVAASFGRAMRVGYVADPFGHPGQMPQLLRGFGYGTYVFSRGIGELLRESVDTGNGRWNWPSLFGCRCCHFSHCDFGLFIHPFVMVVKRLHFFVSCSHEIPLHEIPLIVQPELHPPSRQPLRLV